jgi:hypothetical protein
MENLVVMDDIADLFEELHKTQTTTEIARHFDKERKWFYHHRYGCGIVLTPEFIAGLRHYGYDLKLVKRGE